MPRPGQRGVLAIKKQRRWFCTAQCLVYTAEKLPTWFGWHHYMAHITFALGFLARTQAIFHGDAPALTLPQIVDLLKAVLPKPAFDTGAALERLRGQSKTEGTLSVRLPETQATEVTIVSKILNLIRMIGISASYSVARLMRFTEGVWLFIQQSSIVV